MFGLTTLGAVHTAISLVAVAAGLIAFIRFKESRRATRSARSTSGRRC